MAVVKVVFNVVNLIDHFTTHKVCVHSPFKILKLVVLIRVECLNLISLIRVSVSIACLVCLSYTGNVRIGNIATEILSLHGTPSVHSIV